MISTKARVPRQSIPYILKKGNSYHSELFIIRHTKNDGHNSRYRVIISKKLLREAVDRNKLRRQVYEAIRKNDKESAKQGQDIILIPKKNILTRNYQQIEEDIKKNVLNKSHGQPEPNKQS